MRSVLGVCIIAMALFGQMGFEVASIKPHLEPVTVSGGSVSATRAIWTAIAVVDLIQQAYGIRYDQISGGPGWASIERFDIAAKAPGVEPLTNDAVKPMLRQLLVERFQLKFHREMKDRPVYWLVVGKNGPKLKEPDLAKTGMRTMANASGIHITAWQVGTGQLADHLSVTAGRPVLDKTGLSGKYAFQLDFTPMSSVSTPESDVPAMSTALQEQLGLRVDPEKAPVEMLVIDSVEKPSAN